MGVFVDPYGTSAQQSRGRAIGAKASMRSNGLNSVQAMITTPIPNRVHASGGNRRQVQSSRRLAGMPMIMTLPKKAMTYSGPSMIPDTAQRGK